MSSIALIVLIIYALMINPKFDKQSKALAWIAVAFVAFCALDYVITAIEAHF